MIRQFLQFMLKKTDVFYFTLEVLEYALIETEG